MSATTKHEPAEPSGSDAPTCSVSLTQREVIENKLLAALEDEGTVAILASQQDLEDLIFVLECGQWSPGARNNRFKNLAAGMKQLLGAAFSSQNANVDATGLRKSQHNERKTNDE